MGKGMGKGLGLGAEGVFVKESHPGLQLRRPWGVAHPQVWMGQGVKLPTLLQHRGSELAASHLQAEEPCAPVWKAQ